MQKRLHLRLAQFVRKADTSRLRREAFVRTGQGIAEIPLGKNDSDAFIGFLKRLILRLFC